MSSITENSELAEESFANSLDIAEKTTLEKWCRRCEHNDSCGLAMPFQGCDEFAEKE